MDKGAHFYSCDFQVHTPRDIKWTGSIPTSDEDRKAFSDKFIKACREKGLDAIAITDHHDLVFYKYIKDAAENELDHAGKPIPEDQRIVVYPGMELTLSIPCQAIIIFDADLPSELLATIPTVLSITPNDPSEAKHAEIKKLEHFDNFEKLHEAFDNNSQLKGRYIIFPNVSDGGHGSLLRSGFATHYKKMRCVGGYVDGSMKKLGRGNIDIVNGQNREYGNKAIGVLQTSDSRSYDFKYLGKHTSWIKWSIPTAEALRQACLARHTRISNEEPQYPALIIQSIKVSNSKFMGPIELNFNQQLNCIIGGRGTGKSTILEYLRWALCDQPPSDAGDGEIPDYLMKRKGLIENTLLPLESVVTVSFLLNGVTHIVRRNAKTGKLQLKVDQNEFEEHDEEDLRRLLHVQAYSQKQLSAVSIRQDELNRLIQIPVERELKDIKSRENELKGQLRLSYGKIYTKKLLEKQSKRETFELLSLKQRVKSLLEDLKGLGKADRAIIERHDLFMEEKKFVEDIDYSTDKLKEIIENAQVEIEQLTEANSKFENLPNKDTLEKIHFHHKDVFKTFRGHIQKLIKLFGNEGSYYNKQNELMKELEKKHKLHNDAYEKAKAKAIIHKARLRDIADKEQRIRVLTKSVTEKYHQVTNIGNPEDEYETALKEWTGIYEKRATLLEERCLSLTESSENAIRATIIRGADLSAVLEQLNSIIRGTNIRRRKIEDLCEYITSSSHPIEAWKEILQEFESLTQVEIIEGVEPEMPATPILNNIGLTPSDLTRIASKLTVDEWLDLALTELGDDLHFEYQQREGEYIKFSNASAGQQATALLKVLLNNDGPPLIIDQPEEDLDNQVILNIVEDIWSAKSRRQVIFSSHNANIVVNGDADLVVVCDYRAEGDQSGGNIKCQGAIDIPEIRHEITSIMEGSEIAFNLRKLKYGF